MGKATLVSFLMAHLALSKNSTLYVCRWVPTRAHPADRSSCPALCAPPQGGDLCFQHWAQHGGYMELLSSSSCKGKESRQCAQGAVCSACRAGPRGLGNGVCVCGLFALE